MDNRKLGFNDKSFSQINQKIINKSFEFSIKDLFIFTKKGELIIYNQLNSSNPRKNNNQINFLSNLTLKISKINDTFSNQNENMSFSQININNKKICFQNILKSNYIIVGIFSSETKSSIIKLFLLHIAISFLNYIGEKSYINETLKNKIYESYLFLPLKAHFINITYSLFKNKVLFFSNIKYENLYIIEISSSKVLFDLNSVINNEIKEKIINYNILLNEIIFHANNLKKLYEKKYSNRIDSIEYQDYFVKVEYTSTFPRLTFVIKFLPIFKGIAMVHIYSQSKLSRNETEKIYKEFDIIYGSEIHKDINHIEYKFNEPKLLKEIEMFFIEFFFSTNPNFGFFFYPKSDLKYFSSELIRDINNCIQDETKKNNNNIYGEVVFRKISNYLYQEFLQTHNLENKKKEDMFNYIKESEDSDLDINPIKIKEEKYYTDDDSTIKINEMISTYQWNFLTSTKNINLFQLSKKYSLQILFSNMKINPEINPEDITINLSKSNLSDNEVNDKLSDLLQKSMTTKNVELISNNNENYQFNSSGTLFHLNVTPFRNKKISKMKNVISQNILNRRKKGKFTEQLNEKENNKSAIYVNKIKEEMDEVSSSSSNSNSNSNLSIYT